MPQLRSLQAAQRVVTALRTTSPLSYSPPLPLVRPHTRTALSTPVSFSTSAATASFSSSSTASLSSTDGSTAAPAQHSEQINVSSSSSKQPSGFYASLARLIAPLFRPFRRQLGMDNLAIARFLSNTAITGSLSDPHVHQYHLPPHPTTGTAPLTVLHMWLLHSLLIQHIQRATLPNSPTRPSLDRWQSIHRAALECWWTYIGDLTAPIVGGLMLNKTMIATQTHILGLFQALDLCMQETDGGVRRRLLWSILANNLYSASEIGGRKLEVMRLGEWVEGEWRRLRLVEGGGGESEQTSIRLNIRQLPELKEEDRTEAERTVQLVEYELKEGKLVVGGTASS